MFDNKDRKDDYSSDELELMKMIKEYEQDEANEAKQVNAPETPLEPIYERTAYQAPESNIDRSDSALSNNAHTRVMSRQNMTDETLTILPMGGNKDQEMQFDQTQELHLGSQPQMQSQPQVESEPEPEDDDPRFEIKRKKKKKPKKKKDKKPKGDDDKLNRTVLIAIIIASIIAVLSIGYMVYDAFFKGSGDEKITEPVKDNETTKKPTKKDPVKETETTKEPEKPDYTAEIAALQKLIDQETINAGDFTKKADTLEGVTNKDKETKKSLMTAAEEALKSAAPDLTEEEIQKLQDAFTTAKSNYDSYESRADVAQARAEIADYRNKAQACFDRIEGYKTQIATYQ